MAKDISGTSSYSNGAYQLPQDDDSGSTVFSILEDFMERIATHDHTGSDSKSITANFSKINVIIDTSQSPSTWNSSATEPTGSLAAGSDIGLSSCTIQISTGSSISANKLDTTATMDRDAADVVDYTPMLSFFHLEQVSGTTKYYWQPFNPDYIWTGDQEITLYSNVEYSKIRVVQY